MGEIDDLKVSVAKLEKHVESQDIEVYRQQRLIDGLKAQLNKLEARLDASEQGGDSSSMPADEKPPHY